MGQFKLLGDRAYISQDFLFIIAPTKDNDRLTEAEKVANMYTSRVIIENTFGHLKCWFRRIRDVQNVDLVVMVKLIVAAYTLHTLCMGENFICEDHPDGCPRDNVDNDMWITQQGKLCSIEFWMFFFFNIPRYCSMTAFCYGQWKNLIFCFNVEVTVMNMYMNFVNILTCIYHINLAALKYTFTYWQQCSHFHFKFLSTKPVFL